MRAARNPSALPRQGPFAARCRAVALALLSGCCAAFAAPLPDPAAPGAQPPRPRVGLALSGGGARGFSHVGVLAALEQLRVPVDCVVGTSAGSAVGAAYAVGLSPAEIEAGLRQGDWDGRIFADQPARADLPYREKPRRGGLPGGVTLGVGEAGLRGSAGGVFAGQQIELFLHRLLGVSTELASFDALPVPFRAITTDLVSGEMVVQDQGSLVQAVRASMAVPSAFAPVRAGPRLLVDGGLTQNLPVQVAREACADVVVAVHIGSPLLKAEDLTGLLGVGLQVISILMERNVAESMAALRPADVLIVPDLGEISALDFARGVDGIPAGAQATLAAAGRLQALALDPERYADWQRRRQARRPVAPVVGEVAVAPTRFVAPAFFALDAGAQSAAPGPVEVDRLQRLITRWGGSGNFTHIAYSVRPTRSGYTLWIDPHEKPWGPDYLQLGLAGQVNSGGWSDFAVQAALRKTWLNGWGAEWLTVARFGAARELDTAWFQPLGATSSWFVEPRLRLSSRPLRLFVQDRAVGEFRIDRRDVEWAFGWQGPPGLVRLGLVAARIESEPVLGLLDVPALRSDVDGWRLTLAWDRLDDADFPRDGQALRLETFRTWGGSGEPGSFRGSELEGEIARSAGADGVHARVRWAQAAGGSGAVRDFVTIGGPFQLSGYQPGQFNGRELGFASLGYTRRLVPLPQPFGSGLYAGLALEAARIRDPLGQTPGTIRRHSLALYVGAATALGPAYFGVGFGEQGNRAVYLSLGRP
jgi:NTE family protein